MSEQQPATAAQERPAPEDFGSWQNYWKAQSTPWRTQPEIDEVRQRYLTERRAIPPYTSKGVYPFRDEKGASPSLVQMWNGFWLTTLEG
jgi:hypothetical protein